MKTYRNPKPMPTPAPDKSDTVKIPTPPRKKRNNPEPKVPAKPTPKPKRRTGIPEPLPQIRKTRPGDTLEEYMESKRRYNYTGNSGKTQKSVPSGRVIGPAKKNPIKPRGAR